MKAAAALMESASKAYASANEDMLRHTLRAGVEGKLPGSTVAEASHADGRADILIHERGRRILVVECKLWKGPRAVPRHVDQALGYATWRDRHAALVYFVREWNIEGVVDRATSALCEHGGFVEWLPGNDLEHDLRALFTRNGAPQRRHDLAVLFVHLPKGAPSPMRDRPHRARSPKASGRKPTGYVKEILQPFTVVQVPLPDRSSRSTLELFDRVHGTIRLSPPEFAVLKHPAVARLSRISAMGNARLIFPGATQSGIEHPLGAVHMTQMLVDALGRNHQRAIRGRGTPSTWSPAEPPNETESAFLRLAALLHTVGARPGGEVLERAGFASPSGSQTRVRSVFDQTVWAGGASSVPLRRIIDEEYATHAQAAGIAGSPSDIALFLITGEAMHNVAGDTTRFRADCCRDVAHQAISADFLDLLQRNSYDIGRPRALDPRLLDHLELRERRGSGVARLVLNIGNADRWRADVAAAVCDLTQYFYEQLLAVTFNRHRLVADAMLERLIAEVGEAVPDILMVAVEELDQHSEDDFLPHLIATAQKCLSITHSSNARERLQGALELAARLSERDLHERLVQTSVSSEVASEAEGLRALVGAPGVRRRLQLGRRAEAFLGLRPGHVVVSARQAPFATPLNMPVLFRDVVQPLANADHLPGISGSDGAVQAFRVRFAQLASVIVATSRDALSVLEEQGVSHDAARAYVINQMVGQ